MAASRRPLTNAILNTLRIATGKEVGDHAAPKPPPGHALPAVPYAVLFMVPGGGLSGSPLGDNSADGEFVYQVTSVGDTRDQCEWMSDRVRDALLDFTNGQYVNPIALDGGKVIRRSLNGQTGPTAEGERFVAADVFAFVTTPA